MMGGYLGLGEFTQQSRRTAVSGRISLDGREDISGCEEYLRVGRFHRSGPHPIWPLSNTDSIYFRIVVHLCCSELTDPSRVAAGASFRTGPVQVAWAPPARCSDQSALQGG